MLKAGNRALTVPIQNSGTSFTATFLGRLKYPPSELRHFGFVAASAIRSDSNRNLRQAKKARAK